jgi:hypothetical protein
MNNIYYHKYLKYKKKYLELQRAGASEDTSTSDILPHGFTSDEVGTIYNQLFNNDDRVRQSWEAVLTPYTIDLLANPAKKKECLENFNEPYNYSHNNTRVRIDYNADNIDTYWQNIMKKLKIVDVDILYKLDKLNKLDKLDKLNKLDKLEKKNTVATHAALIEALTLAKTVNSGMFSTMFNFSDTTINLRICNPTEQLINALIGLRNIYITDIESFIETPYEFPIDVLFCFTTYLINYRNIMTTCKSKINNNPTLDHLIK